MTQRAPSTEPARLTPELWSSIEDLYAAILDHPFLTGLADGSLDRAAFRHYIVQDALYLREYARALSVVAARAPDTGSILLFSRAAAEAVEVERLLHTGLARDFGLEPEEIERARPAPTTLAYTSYLLATAYGGSFAEGLAAVLPCFWIYWEVGKTLAEHGSPDPLYHRWIEAYAGEDFGAQVRSVLEVTDALGTGLGAGERGRMREHFVQTSRYEWLFWDMGYRMEAWRI